jgi:hypothetical protein
MKRRTKSPKSDDPGIVDARVPTDEEISAALFPSDDEISPVEPPSKARRHKRLNREFFLAPIWLLKEIKRAHAWRAFPLILAVYRRMRMRETDSVALTEQVWAECDELGQSGRRAVLAQIRKIPGIMVITSEHRLQWRYRLTLGALWDNPPPSPESRDRG